MKGVLKVLMWKHFIVRIRRFIHTPVEIISPALLFILLFLIKDHLVGQKPNVEFDDSIQQTDTVEIDSVYHPAKIYYTPETDFTKRLMKLVENYYELHPPLNSYGANAKPSIMPIQNLSAIQKPPKDVAVVIFKGLDLSDEKPSKLTYTIRINEDFKTHSYVSEDVYIGPHYGFGTIYETFMKLQWAIDSGYLKILGEHEIPENVALKEFPYKKSKQDFTVAMLGELIASFSWMSLLLIFVFLMARLLEERVTGIQELIKMVGVSNTMLNLSHVLNSVPAGLVFSIVPTVLLTITATPILPHTNPFLIFLMLILYFFSVISMAFASSYIANSTQYTVTIATFTYLFLSVPARVVTGVGGGVPRWLLPLCALLPHIPMDWFWDEVAALEQFERGLNFSNMSVRHSAQTMSALVCYIYLILQTIIFFSLSWYLSLVRPGPYGQALPWNFICMRQYWTKTKVTPEDQDELEGLEEEDINPEYFEPPLKDAEVGIKIANVTKIFGKNRALNNVSLDVYKGEITVLLGHNGAGKTTLMSIITGMLKPTEGKVYVEGFDTETQKEEMHKYLGLCPQHNLFFPDLTVIEHVIFFSMIKGISYSAAKESSQKLLTRLGLQDKLHVRSSSLSGGMQRRLQLACALAGDARVLVLDEPTSGLDVETRRGLWDLLLALRGERTVLLSTHFMEEAEALGERVAALRGGRLMCRASTMRLKRAIGSGYRLSFTTIGLPNEPALTAAILSVIPEASLKETSLNSISYNLPAKSSDKFPKLFNLLESKRSELGINTIGVGISTLEEVFLKLCSDITTTFTDDVVDGQEEELLQEEVVTGFRLYKQQLMVLLMRQIKYLWSKKISFIVMQVIAPIVMMILFTTMTNNSFSKESSSDEDKSLAMDLNMYNTMNAKKALYNINSKKYNMDPVIQRHPNVVFEKANDVATAVLRVGSQDAMEYNKYLIGIELNDTDAKVLFTTVVRHAAPVALNVLSNVVAAARGASVSTYNEPAYEHVYRASDAQEPKELLLVSMWAFLLAFVLPATIVNCAALPCRSRARGTRHLHVMAGCAPALHWAAALLAHAALYALALLLPALVLARTLDEDRTIDAPDFLAALGVILMLGILAFLALVYLVSFNFSERGAGVVLTVMLMVFGVIFPALGHLPKTDSNKLLHGFLDMSSYIVPPHTFTVALVKAAHIARNNAFPHFERKSYFSYDESSPGPTMLVLFIQFLVYMTLVVLTESGLFNSLADRVLNASYAPPAAADADAMVRAERAYVDKAIALPPKQIQDAMLIHDLHKNYWNLLSKSCNAVRGISFSVKKGECFGLLGVNGAGKSTTFKMLTAMECPTRGSIFANGYFMKMLSGEYLRSLGYCPQTLALDEFLSGRDNLALLLTLRGVAPHRLPALTDQWIAIVGLERYASRALAGYSGGCARRLSAAAALCAGACSLLDEPTAGVDVAARRRLWAAVRRARRLRALIVCSHSMDEMEALCGRIAIMSRGRIRALGEAAELRAAHGAGHALTLKLTHAARASPAAPAAPAARATDEPDNAMSDLNRLKATLREKFNCTLTDEHSTTLHYHINDTLRYSDLFTTLEKLKEKFPELIEDYSVTETTLEEVFLAFAKEENNEGLTYV